jgi:putative tryptophan/tyrosine transport system substrate-binding protein
MSFDRLGRREFITLLGGSAAWPIAARGQQPGMPVVGWLSGRNSETDALLLPTFRQALNAQGFIEGRNVAIEYRWADGQPDRLPFLAADLMRSPAAVIVAVGIDVQGLRAAQAAAATTPIVFIITEDPVTSGLVASLNRPGGNLTGVLNLQSQSVPKRLGFLRELLPPAATVAVLANPKRSARTSETETHGVEEAARAAGLQIKILSAGTEQELGESFANLAQMRADALFVLVDPFLFSRANQIVAAAARLMLPAMYHRREFVTAGGLMSYGPNAEEGYRVLGEYAGRVLKGMKPGDLPIQQSSKLELVINLNAAKALGLTVPPSLLAIADEVIE